MLHHARKRVLRVISLPAVRVVGGHAILQDARIHATHVIGHAGIRAKEKHAGHRVLKKDGSVRAGGSSLNVYSFPFPFFHTGYPASLFSKGVMRGFQVIAFLSIVAFSRIIKIAEFYRALTHLFGVICGVHYRQDQVPYVTRGMNRPVFSMYTRYSSPKVSSIIFSSRGIRYTYRGSWNTIKLNPAIQFWSRSI